MKITNKTLIKAMVWVVAEILLNFIGLDDLADYSEFIFERTAHRPRVAIAEMGTNLGFNVLNGVSDRSPF